MTAEEFQDLRKNNQKYEVNIESLDIDNLLLSAEDQTCFDYHGLFNNQVDKYFNTDSNLASAFLLLADIFSMCTERDELSLDFYPLASSREYRSFNLEDCSDNDIKFLKDISSKVKNPVFLARITDVVWQFTRHNDYATKAANYYAKSALVSLKNRDELEAYENIKRSVLIYTKIKDNDKLKLITRYLLCWMKKNQNFEKQIFTDRISRLLLEIKQVTKIIEIDSLAQSLTNLMHLSHKQKKYQVAIDRCELLSKIYQRLGNSEQKKIYELKTIELHIEFAEELETSDKIPNAIICLSSAYYKLKNIGNTQELRDKVNNKLTDLQQHSSGAYFEHEESIDLSRVAAEAIDCVRDLDSKTALINFAFSLPLKKVEDLEQEVRNNINQYVFQNLFNTIYVDERGRTRGVSTSFDQNDDSNNKDTIYAKMIQTASVFNAHGYVVGIINPMYQYIINNYRVDNQIIRLFCFENTIIPEDKAELLTRGFKYCFKLDFVPGMSILIPQLESILKHILTLKGLNISTFKKDGVIQEDRMLTDLLHTYKSNLEDIIGKDMYFEINHVFNERLSYNIRNDFCHGKMSNDDFYTTKSMYAFWLLWRLCVWGKLYFRQNEV